jgi:DNA-binding beta-propeller fold protein YncE
VQTLPATAAPAYQLKARLVIAGDGGWDYLTCDPDDHRLFVTRGQRVQVLNLDTGVVVGEIADTPGVHGVALDAELGKGYTSNGSGNSVTVFDQRTLKTLSMIALTSADNLDFIALDAGNHRVFAFNGKCRNASVIDARNDRQVATMPLAVKPVAAVADGRGHWFVDIEDTNQISRIDTAAAQVDAAWALPGCGEPAGLAIDVADHCLFVGCHNKALVVLKADNGALLAILPIGEGVDATVFDLNTRQVFSSQADGSQTVIQTGAGDRYRAAADRGNPAQRAHPGLEAQDPGALPRERRVRQPAARRRPDPAASGPEAGRLQPARLLTQALRRRGRHAGTAQRAKARVRI